MGVDLVKAAVARHADLPARPYKALIRMCLSAHDRDTADTPARIYRGGWEPLALALGYSLDDPARHAAVRKEVTRACRDLKDRGIIKPLVENPGVGTRQYWLIEPMVGGQIAPPVGGQIPPPSGGAKSPH